MLNGGEKKKKVMESSYGQLYGKINHQTAPPIALTTVFESKATAKDAQYHSTAQKLEQ